ncbi:cell envelope-related transcriptional attenuator [Anaerovibrio sp. JC8]|uniref:LCP family protein n=1 Tax=Anaerovibrio sp. JC8 TaxID=1240085 RepID=UPI000A0B38A4|nr:LCP family protein [Anaerovibrio sp. JC8]ORT98991.1 cell envelope-related transcriptional attenuator [Anaerovibrio sp. JC8]
MKKKPYSETRERIKHKQAERRRKRNLKITRIFFAIFLCTVLLVGVGWGSMQLYQWGNQRLSVYMGIYDDYKQRRELRAASFDPRFDGYTNILLLGLDPGKEDAGQSADSVIFLSFKHDTGQLRFMTIPRYTMVNIQGRNAPEPLNNAYYYGGIPLMEQTVSKNFGVTIHHYVAIDTEALAEIVDAIGGIDIYVDNNLDYDDPEGELYIHIPKGAQHMEGDMAQKYLRFASDDLGAYGRGMRQQKFLKAFFNKMMEPDSLSKLPAIVEICDKRVKSSIEAFDSGHFASLLTNMQGTKPLVTILPGELQHDGSWIYNPAKTTELIDELFPLEQPEKDN